MPNSKRLLLLALFLLAAPAPAQDRTLYWDDISVTARLDARGTLHVLERQTFVFTGDWNGGERHFNVRLSQDLDLQRIARVGEDGREIPLVEGDLEQVDHFDWEGNTLRWRSRLPSDPLFQETPITYVLEYTYGGILSRKGDIYTLNHDFGMPDVEWPIRKFSLDLELDPAWQPLAPVPAHLEERNLVPGTSLVVRNELRHTGAMGAEAPDPGVSLVPLPWRAALFGASLLAMLYLYFVFRDKEAKRGRFDPLPVPREWDEEWLRKNVFDMRPEEVGVLWDQKIGPAEVAAVLARLVAEGKMTSEVRPGPTLFGFAIGSSVLHLRLKVERHEFVGFERELVDKLFFDGDDTDTARIRAHYRSTGFNPVKTIENGLRSRLKAHGDLDLKKPDRRRTLYLSLAVLALAVLGIAMNPGTTLVLYLIVLFVTLWITIAGITAAITWRKRTESLNVTSLLFLVPGLMVWLWSFLAVFHPDLGIETGLYPGVFGVAGLALLPVAVWSSLLNQASSRESDRTLQKRRLLGAGRRLLQRELKSPNPRLKDEWLPYLLAFGLGTDVDRWFRSFAGASAGRSVGGYSGSSSGAGGIGQSTWSGGGGSFGGGGSTGAWAVAATGLASGVSAPSSSGGGGGGGGGSSSGGGGGGGW